jgi:4-amino-4-deoxy-L-arabinose transferase-like glycosyltransferase
MFGSFNHRLIHYLLLTAIGALLTLPNLGAPSLWDIDEGVNAEAAREMFESGDFVVPRLNFQLRDAKPALLYWLQAGSYRLFGVNEFAARLPSALAAMLAALLIYELARLMFGPAVGLLSGIVSISSLLVCALARFANPDALLLASTCLTFLAFFAGYAPRKPGDAPRRTWFVPFGIACGVGMLAKGPVALVLPGTVIVLFLAWQRQLVLLWDRRQLWGCGAFALVALPWYVMVTIQTRGAFAKGFFLTNNLNRFMAPMEDHRGPIWYHALVLLAGFAPWSIFLAPTIWHAIRDSRRCGPADRLLNTQEMRRPAAARFLICWCAVYLFFFSLSATKLPNYTLPMYPALAILTADFLNRWRRREIQPPRWAMAYCLAWLPIIGVATIAGFGIASGRWQVADARIPKFPLLGGWIWLGWIPIVGGAAAAIFASMNRRTKAVISLCSLSVAFVVGIIGFAAIGVDAAKAPRSLTSAAGTMRRDRDIRLASYQYTQPSLVFYNQREIRPLPSEQQVVQFLNFPLPSFLFIPEPVWQDLQREGLAIGEPIARHHDLYRNCEVLVIANRPPQSLAKR